MRKIRCIIVEDEELIVERLKLFFTKHDDRFDLIGHAYSGQEGIQLALQLQPDIVVTDIVMPGMDGIMMIQSLKERLPSTFYIILTAYAKFEYARSALHLEVQEYVNKVPMDEEAILKALEKTSYRIVEFEMKRRLQQTHREHMYRIRKQILKEIIGGELHPSRMEVLAKDLQFHFIPSFYNGFVIELDSIEHVSHLSQADKSLIRFAMMNIAEETIQSHTQGFCSEIAEDRLFGILTWPHMYSDSENNQRCLTLGNELIANMRNYLKFSVSIGFSGIAKGWEQLPKVYKEAADIFEDVYYKDKGAILTPLHRIRYEARNVDELHVKIQDFMQHLQSGSQHELLLTRLRDMKSWVDHHKIPRTQMIPIVLHLLESIRRRLQDQHRTAPLIQVDTIKSQSFNKQWEFLLGYLENGFAAAAKHSRKPEIVKAKEFIALHITERISLGEVAEHVNLTPAYFSGLFKKEESVSLVDYINQRKVELAAEMLKKRDYSNQELGDAIGIYNERYFITLFKQFIGESPQKYRKRWFT
ncbi:response regulator [Paenibacillus sp. GCM10023248]|uniref:response regulator transcription factor n=1 Tax=unclassified Paenibacillus TaxID=185978 RepID=UPI002379597C|nr:response regulator [Paenibacillus sp. MAHUQ-63]MDD9271204.1 response regulator [Paenibacillus sp. MAHUQ-63]